MSSLVGERQAVHRAVSYDPRCLALRSRPLPLKRTHCSADLSRSLREPRLLHKRELQRSFSVTFVIFALFPRRLSVALVRSSVTHHLEDEVGCHGGSLALGRAKQFHNEEGRFIFPSSRPRIGSMRDKAIRSQNVYSFEKCLTSSSDGPAASNFV